MAHTMHTRSVPEPEPALVAEIRHSPRKLKPVPATSAAAVPSAKAPRLYLRSPHFGITASGEALVIPARAPKGHANRVSISKFMYVHAPCSP